MKATVLAFLFLSLLLTGCKSVPACAWYYPAVIGTTVAGKTEHALKPHIYAPAGTRLDDFEQLVMEGENESSVILAAVPETNGTICFDYLGKKAVYLGRFVKERTPLPPQDNSPLFFTNEIWNATALAAKLKGSADPVSAWMFQHFSARGREIISSLPASGMDEATLREVIVKEMNAIVLGPAIYDEMRFKNISLRPETASYLKVHPPVRYAARFQIVVNRKLLEDAYPHELVMKQNFRGMHYYIAVKY